MTTSSITTTNKHEIINLYNLYGPTFTNVVLLSLKSSIISNSEDFRYLSPLFFPRFNNWIVEEERTTTTRSVEIVNQDQPLFLYHSINDVLLPSFHSIFIDEMNEDNDSNEYIKGDLFITTKIETTAFTQKITLLRDILTQKLTDSVIELMLSQLKESKIESLLEKELLKEKKYSSRIITEWMYLQENFIRKMKLDFTRFKSPLLTKHRLIDVRPFFFERVIMNNILKNMKEYIRIQIGDEQFDIAYRSPNQQIAIEGVQPSETKIDLIHLNEGLLRAIYKVDLKWSNTKLYNDNTMSAYLTHFQQLKEKLHEQTIINLLYGVFNDDDDKENSPRVMRGGFHFRYVYGTMLFKESTLHHYMLIIKENTIPLKYNLPLETLIMIIFQVLYALEFAWDTIRFTHNDLIGLKYIVSTSYLNRKSYIYRRKRATYVFKGGSDVSYSSPLIKLIPSSKSQWKIRDDDDDDYDSNDVRDLLTSLLPLWKKEDRHKETHLEAFLIFCHKVGVTSNDIESFKRLLHIDDSHYMKWDEKQLTPWNCLDFYLFDQFKVQDTLEDKVHLIKHPKSYVLVDGAVDEKRRQFLKPKNPILPQITSSFPSLTVYDLLKNTNIQLTYEIKAYFKQWNDLQLLDRDTLKNVTIQEEPLRGRTKVTISLKEGIEEEETPLRSIVYYMTKETERPKGRSRSYFYQLDKNTRFTLKRFPTVITEDDTEESRKRMQYELNDIIKAGDRITKSLNQWTIRENITYSFNFTKIVALFSVWNDSYDVDTVMETLDYEIDDYIRDVYNITYTRERFNDILQTILFEIFHALETAWVMGNFIHGDLNMKNVMLQKPDIPLLRKKGYDWLYKRHVLQKAGASFLYKMNHLEDVKGKSDGDLIVKILDFGSSKILNTMDRLQLYYRRKDVHLFLLQLLVYTSSDIWHDYKESNSKGYNHFVDLCKQAISFQVQSSFDAMFYLKKNYQAHKERREREEGEYLPSSIEPVALTNNPPTTHPLHWKFFGIRIENPNLITISDYEKFTQFEHLFNQSKPKTIGDLMAFTITREYSNEIDMKQRLNRVISDLYLRDLMYSPVFDHNQGLSASLVLDHAFFDSMMIEIVHLYEKPCILLSDRVDKEEEKGVDDDESVYSSSQDEADDGGSGGDRSPLSDDSEATALYDDNNEEEEETVIHEDEPDTYDDEGGEGEDEDENENDFKTIFSRELGNIKEMNQFESFLIRNEFNILFKVKELGDECRDFSKDATRQVPFIRNLTLTLDDITKKRSWTWKLNSIFKGILYDDDKPYVINNIKAGKWLILQYHGTMKDISFNREIDFQFKYDLIYGITGLSSPFTSPLRITNLKEENGYKNVEKGTFLVYHQRRKTTTEVVKPTMDMLLFNQTLYTSLIYDKFDNVDDLERWKGVGLVRYRNDCYKNSLFHAVRYILYQFVRIGNNPPFIPKALNDIFKLMNNASGNLNIPKEVEAFGKLVINTTHDDILREMIQGNEQCDPHEVLVELWDLMFKLNTCNTKEDVLFASSNVFIPLNELDYLTIDMTRDVEFRSTTSVQEYFDKNRIQPKSPILCIYHQGGKGQSMNLEKVSMTFDLVFNTLEKERYTLFSLISHTGSMGISRSGHYITYLRLGNSDKNDTRRKQGWTLFNDENTIELDDGKVPNEEITTSRLTIYPKDDIDVPITITPYLGFYVKEKEDI